MISYENIKMLVSALESITKELSLIRAELSEIKELVAEQKTETESKKGEKTEKRDKGNKKTKWTTEDVYNFIKENCPKTFQFLQKITQFKSGDFLIKLDYMTNKEYQDVRDELKEQLEAEYSRKYQGFIIKASKLR